MINTLILCREVYNTCDLINLIAVFLCRLVYTFYLHFADLCFADSQANEERINELANKRINELVNKRINK